MATSTSTGSRRAARLAGVAALVMIVLSSCSHRSPEAKAPPLRAARFADAGPFAAGVRTLREADGRKVVVWYPVDRAAAAGRQKDVLDLRTLIPADRAAGVSATAAAYPTDSFRDAPVSGHGPFPVVAFSHGLGAAPELYQFLTAHLATWGFVVTAPDYRERDLAATFFGTIGDVDEGGVLLSGLDTAMADPDLGRASRRDQVAVAGHSSGTEAAIAAAADPRVRAVVLLSPDPDLSTPPAKPALVMVGADDHANPATIAQELYGRLPPPKRLVTLQAAGHVTFSDVCALGAGQGGVVGLLTAAGVHVPPDIAAIATDGCDTGALPTAAAWPAIRDVVVGDLRAALGIDASPLGLDAAALADLAPAHLEVQQQPTG